MREQAPRIYAVSIHKGGVGKTTTAVNVADCLAEKKRRVLLIDVDPQGHASEHLHMKMPDSEHTPAARLLLGLSPLSEVVVSTPFGFDLVRGGKRTSAADSVFRESPEDKSILGRELRQHGKHYDVVLIDCPPNFGPLVQTALRAADGVIVPLLLEYFPLSGLADLLASMDTERQHNPQLSLTAIFACNSDPKTVLAKDVLAQMAERFPKQFLQTAIRYNVRLAEAPSAGQPVSKFAPKSNGALDYRALTTELIARGAA